MDETNWTDFWLDRWQQGRIHFHQQNFEALLSRFPQVKDQVVFVPLCGKSKDMLYFAELGNRVIGVELSQSACVAFMAENNLAYEREEIPNFTVFKSKTITLYCGDFFQLDLSLLDGVSLIYDRAALIALPSALREKYVKFISRWVEARGNGAQQLVIYLITLEYASKTPMQPPFSVSAAEIKKLYAEHFQIEKIFSEDDAQYSPTEPATEALPAVESAYLLTSKSKG